MIVAQCSSIPYVIDNESYYIQTIKWINEYGFVKGIVNLHFFLGQTSGWHITQSVFNFSFLYSNFNDLSGFVMLLGAVFSIQKLDEFSQNKNSNYLLIGLFPISSIFLFQFISAPSPDIPVYVLSFIIFFYFLENFKDNAKSIQDDIDHNYNLFFKVTDAHKNMFNTLKNEYQVSEQEIVKWFNNKSFVPLTGITGASIED
jgi:hypothetical protein